MLCMYKRDSIIKNRSKHKPDLAQKYSLVRQKMKKHKTDAGECWKKLNTLKHIVYFINRSDEKATAAQRISQTTVVHLAEF